MSALWTTNKTFRCVKPFGATLWTSVIILLALVIALELGLRAEPLQQFLGRLIPNLGSKHLQLEEQFARLNRFAAAEGKVDCVFLGSSLVWLGIDPATFEEVFELETGRRVRCFNFGIEALPTNAAADLTEVIVRDHHPWLLIYGTSARDYAIDSHEEESRVVTHTPWLQDRLGQRTVRSWLVMNSYTVRFVKEMSRLLLLERHSWNSLSQPDISQGFLGKTTVAQRDHYVAAARDAATWLRPYEIQEENVEGLSKIVRQREKGVAIVVVEMPVNSQYFAYFENGKEDYTRFITLITNVAVSEDAILLRAPAYNVIPEDGWWDRSHLNQHGAEAFTQWLADRVAYLSISSEIVLVE